MVNPPQQISGKAVMPRPRRTYSPKEASLAAKELRNLDLSSRWFARHCARGEIRTLPLSGRHLIPEEELMRVLGIVDLAETEGIA